jgi:hypothetical protein
MKASAAEARAIAADKKAKQAQTDYAHLLIDFTAQKTAAEKLAQENASLHQVIAKVAAMSGRSVHWSDRAPVHAFQLLIDWVNVHCASPIRRRSEVYAWNPRGVRRGSTTGNLWHYQASRSVCGTKWGKDARHVTLSR